MKKKQIDPDKVKKGEVIRTDRSINSTVLGIADAGLYLGYTSHGLVRWGRAWFETWSEINS